MSRKYIFVLCCFGSLSANFINGNAMWAAASICGSAIALLIHWFFEAQDA